MCSEIKPSEFVYGLDVVGGKESAKEAPPLWLEQLEIWVP